VGGAKERNEEFVTCKGGESFKKVGVISERKVEARRAGLRGKGVKV